MPLYIIKIDRETDRYVYWSDIVEAPCAWGTRAEVSELMREWSHDAGPERFDRADDNGCSSIPRFYWFDSAGMIYQQQGWLKRADLWELCQRLGRDEDVTDLLEHFEDCECSLCLPIPVERVHIDGHHIEIVSEEES